MTPQPAVKMAASTDETITEGKDNGICVVCKQSFEEYVEESAPVEGQLTLRLYNRSHIVMSPNRTTAYNKSPLDCIIGEELLTSRQLKPNELFEVRLDKKVEQSDHSIRIGVTCDTGIEQLTWYMLRNKVRRTVCESRIVVQEYNHNLDHLKVGDCVGVQRRADRSLHFYINGVDLGVAETSVPDDVYGFIHLYPVIQQVTVIDTSAALQTSCDEPELVTQVSDTPQLVHRVLVMERLKQKFTLKKTPRP